MSSLVTGVFFIAAAAILFITRFTTSNTVKDFIIRHSFYEFCYLAQVIAMPMGFVVHFIKSKPYENPVLRKHPMDGRNILNNTTTTATMTSN